MNKEEMIEAKKLNPVDFLAKVLEAGKAYGPYLLEMQGPEVGAERLRLPPGGYHRLVQDHPLAPLLEHS